MSPALLRFSLWITLQMMLALIGPHSASAIAHFRPYLSEFRYTSQYHPSRNPDCTSQRLRRSEFSDGQSENGRRLSFEKPLVDRNRPWIEIRAVVVRCAKMQKETEISHSIRNCRRKVVINMRINNAGKTNTREEFVLIDHILDPIKMRKIKLRNPYVIKVRQEPLLHLYGLRFQGVVNAEAREEVINNRRANFTGCNDGLDNPTCGQMLINEETIPFSEGFCCSCEDALRAKSFHSPVAKSNYYQRRDDSANSARNRSDSSANLFDNSTAPRQIDTYGNAEEDDRQVGLENDVAAPPGRITSRNISAVDGLFGERAPTPRKRQERKWFRNNARRRYVRPFKKFLGIENVASRATTSSPVLNDVVFDASPSEGKIEAYIDAAYEPHAMKDDKRSKDLMDQSGLSSGNLGDNSQDSSQEGVGRSPIGLIMNNFRDAKSTNIKGNRDSGQLKFRESNTRLVDRYNDRRSSIPESDANNSPIMKLIILADKQDFTKTGGEEDNRKFVELRRCGKSGNFSKNGNREERTMDRCREHVTRLENTFDYTPTFPAVQPIPEESQFSRRTEKSVFSNGDNASTDKRDFFTTVGFIASPGIPFGNNTNGNVNYGITSSTIKSNDFEANAFAQLSKIVISETRSSTVCAERRSGVSGNVSDNVNAPRNASFESSSASAIPNDEGRKAGNSNVSTRILIVSTFTRLQNPSPYIEISRTGGLSATTAVFRDESSTRTLESETRDSLTTNETRRFSDVYGNLHAARESSGLYNPSEQTSKDVNLKNSDKFWKSRRKLRKSKGVEKLDGNKGIRRKSGRLGIPSRRELIWKRASSNFERDKFRNEPSKGERRFRRRLRRHLPTGKGDLSIANVRNVNSMDEDSRRKTEVVMDDYTRPVATTRSKRRALSVNDRENGSPNKQVILESGQSRGKIRPAESDNTFLFDESGKESNVDKRIEDKFVEISNAPKGDFTGAKIIQETPKNLKEVERNEVKEADNLKIRDEVGNDLLSRISDKSDDPIAICGDGVTYKHPVKLIDTHQRSIASGNFAETFLEFATIGNEVSTILSSKRKNFSLLENKESIPSESKERSFTAIVDPFLPASIMRKSESNASEDIKPDASNSSLYEFATKHTECFAQRERSSETPRGRDHLEAVDGPLRAPSNSRAIFEEMFPGAANNPSKSERDEAENARTRELNNNPSRMITDDSTGPRGESIAEPENLVPSDEEGEDVVPVSVAINEELSTRSRGSRETDGIAELTHRVVRRNAGFTPIMPGMPTFDDVTEAETLPPEDVAAIDRFVTTMTIMATTTRITDVMFRPSLRSSETTTSLPEEMRDEISLDDTTFVDETEATTARRERTTAFKRKFSTGRSSRASTSSGGMARKVSPSKSKSSERQRRKFDGRITGKEIDNVEREAVRQPWYRTTEAQQIIARSESRIAKKTEGRGKKQRYKSRVDDTRKLSSSTTISVRARRKRLDFIRASSDRDFSILRDYVNENEMERRDDGKTASNKIEESFPYMTEPTELRRRIEERLIGELDYPANRKSLRHSCESRDQTQRHNTAIRDIASRNVVFHTNNNLAKRALGAQEKKRFVKDASKDRTLSYKPYRAEDDEIGRLDEEDSSKSHRAVSLSFGAPSSTTILSEGSTYAERTYADREMKEGRACGEREITANTSANASRTANASASDPTDRISRRRARNSGDKSKTDTVVGGVKLMMAYDKGDLAVAVKSADKNVPLSFRVAKQPGHAYARKINESPVANRRVRRVSATEGYFRRSRRSEMYDNVCEMIGAIEKERSSFDVANVAMDVTPRRADRSSARRLLSSEKFEDAVDEYYEDDDESETDGKNSAASDNGVIAKRDDSSDLEDRSGLREDLRNLAEIGTIRSASENIDARTIVSEERTVASRDAEMIPADTQEISEETISRNNAKEVKNTNSEARPYDIEVVLESTDPMKNLDKSSRRNSRMYEKIAEEPLSFSEEINNDLSDKSFYGTQPIFNAEEIMNLSSTSNQNPLRTGVVSRDVDLSRDSEGPRNEGSIKISLTGRIELKDDFNQTPMPMNLDPDWSSIIQSSASTEPSNAIVSIETTVIHLLSDNSNAEYTFDLSSITERANDEANDPLNAMLNVDREAEKRNANRVELKPRDKFLDLPRRNERKIAKKNPIGIEKRLDGYNAKSRTAKQVFLTDYSRRSNVTNGGTIDKTPRSSVVYFPNILGSVSINNDSPKDRNVETISGYRMNLPSTEANRSDFEIDRSNTTDLDTAALANIEIERPGIDRANDASNGRWNDTSGDCYRMPTIARKLELTETTPRVTQTSSNYRDSDLASTFQPGIHEAITDDRNVTTVSTSSMRLQNVSEGTIGSAMYGTFSGQTLCEKCNDESINARNMMAIVRFLMKLLKVIAEEEDRGGQQDPKIGETMIRANNIVVNVSSRDENRIGKRKSITVRRITSERMKQDLLTTAEWRPIITERSRGGSSPSDTFEPFAEVPSHPTATSTLQTSLDEVSRNEGPSMTAHASALSTSTAKSFLFYEPERKSFHRDTSSRWAVGAGVTGIKQNSRISFDDSKEDSRRKRSRLNDDQTNRSSRDQTRNFADRSHFGKHEIASARNSKRDEAADAASSRERYSARNKSDGSRFDAVNDTVAAMLTRDIDVSRDARLESVAAASEGEFERSAKSRKTAKAGTLNRRVTRTRKLLNSSARGGSRRDWIGKRRTAARQLQVDKKLRESRNAPDVTATREKAVFRRVSGKINRPGDPDLAGSGGGGDAFKIEESRAGSDSLAKLSTDYVLSGFDARSSSLRGEGNLAEKANATRHPSISLSADVNIGISKIDEEILNEHTRYHNFTSPRGISSKKRNVSGNGDSQKGNRVLGKRQKAAIPKRKTKWLRKKKRMKSAKRTKDITVTGDQRHFKRHLLMAPREPIYDIDDDATRLSRFRYIAEGRNVENFRRFARANTGRRREDGSRGSDGSGAGRAQIRGGQDCTNRKHPPNIDAFKYLESAHCLRFSDLWYSVYQLENPIVEHTVYLQVYEKRTLANGSTYWKDLTEDSVVRLGTFNTHHKDSDDTIAFAYKEVKMSRHEDAGEEDLPNLDIVRDRLLVPSSVTSKGSGYPIEGESNEYLVVPASGIDQSGNECDKAGVGFGAFARQPDRCGRVSGTCLKNQPLAYRRHDVEARVAGRPGCYFLSNFASVPSEPIKYSANGSGSREFLALEYHSPHVSAIDIEIRSGYNAALAAGPLGRISEVHVDGTAIDHTVITVTIANTGRSSTFYRLKIADCPDDLPESWVNATFPKKLVQPRRDETMSLDLYGELFTNEFYCSARLLNRFGEPVATRRIKIRKMDRCSCTRHCLCICVGEMRDTECRPMSPELFHAAGYRGPVPGVPREIFSDTTINILLFVVSLILLLLFIGILKWLIGLYVPAVSRWGLDSLQKTNGMSEYFERELKCRCVMTDEHGAPVHPDTRKRTVRICGRKAEFFLNAMFFLTFPFAICCRRLSRPIRRHYCSDESKISLTNDKSETPRTICVNTYGDNRDTQMEAEDTKYVMDELKKSEELLRCRNKKCNCIRGHHPCH